MNEDTKALQERIANTAAGSVAETTKAASHPGRTARNRVRSLERSRTPTARQARRQAAQLVTGAASATTALVNGIIPSKIVFRGLGLVKSQARRRDLVGEAAYRAARIAAQRPGWRPPLTQPPAGSQPAARPDQGEPFSRVDPPESRSPPTADQHGVQPGSCPGDSRRNAPQAVDYDVLPPGRPPSRAAQFLLSPNT